ncbi:calcium-binding protein [Chloroflexota bacterium]
MDKERLRDLLWDATADCHDDEEAFWGLFYALAEEGLSFPLKAKALGSTVEIVDLDGRRSSLRRGIVALVRKGEQEYPVSLAEIEFVDPDPSSAEWLAVYRYWLNLW